MCGPDTRCGHLPGPGGTDVPRWRVSSLCHLFWTTVDGLAEDLCRPFSCPTPSPAGKDVCGERGVGETPDSGREDQEDRRVLGCCKVEDGSGRTFRVGRCENGYDRGDGPHGKKGKWSLECRVGHGERTEGVRLPGGVSRGRTAHRSGATLSVSRPGRQQWSTGLQDGNERS